MPIAVFTAFGLILLSCGAAPNDPGRTYYSDYHFSIVFPPGWHVDVDRSEQVVEAWEGFANNDDMFEENMSVTYERLTKTTSLESYYREVNHNTGLEFANWRIENQGEITLDGQSAKATRATFTLDEGMLRMIGYVTIKGDHAITIACLMEPQNYGKYQPIFKQAVHSLRFE
jgi:hypothetical protein